MELNKQVVMLPTKNKALIYTDRYGNLKSHSTESTLPLDSIGSNYHLSVLSDEEIKEGDWCYDKIPDDNGNLIDTIYQKKKGPQYQDTSTERKIIATTDDSLTFIDDCYHRYFPTLPLKFIQDYIKAYNTSKPITEVMIEYEGKSGRILSYGRGIIPPDIHVKVDKDNQIIVKSRETIKNNWISVDEKLPPNNRAVLVSGKGIPIDIGWKLDSRNYEWCKYNGGELFDAWQKVEWWQFLPDPPKQ